MAKQNLPELDPARIPQHVAIIMDGNGRWAKKRFLPRIAGHKQGMEVVKTITKAASHLGVKVLTLYAFSTENWKTSRQRSELFNEATGRFLQHLCARIDQRKRASARHGRTRRLACAHPQSCG